MKRFLLLFSVLFISFVLVLTPNAYSDTINFDEYALGTPIDDEYASYGVLFHEATYQVPVISLNGAMPNQPVLRPGGGPSTFQGDYWIEFTTLVDEIEFQSGYWDTLGTADFDFYASDKTTLLGSYTNTVTGAEVLSVSGIGNIGWMYFNSVSDPAGGDISYLTFNQVPDASIMLLLGSSLFGLGLFGRKRKRS